MVDYSKGKIYKIVCNVTELIYVGSTCEKYLSNRLAGHLTAFKRYQQGKCRHITSFKIIENHDYYIELIENYPCKDKYELLKRERFHSDSVQCINKRHECTFII
jgi:hypothetical protein